MTDEKKMTRRTWGKTAGLGLGLTAASCCSTGSAEESGDGNIRYRNEDFYNNGEFNIEAAKDALVELMRHHHYPVFDGVRDQLWISDYGIGEYASVGLGALLFFNHDAEDPGDRFMLLDIYLLPNQMLPEHYHVKSEKARPKMEAWIVRHGMAEIVGEGEPTSGLKQRIPESQREHCTVWNAVKCEPGDKVELNRATARHWQLAGPEGAILSEVANFHDNDAVRHSNPNLVFP
ncbi:unnamed protein product [marine sediment metagenome]|uniref:D-lyxose ketol-isomerase n=1 Tax=marine sediment metagenome TaxID=412755 RepID=X1CBY1_9ZZZZ